MRTRRSGRPGEALESQLYLQTAVILDPGACALGVQEQRVSSEGGSAASAGDFPARTQTVSK